jgi:O-antigen ligase
LGVAAVTGVVLVIAIGAGVAWLGGDQLTTGIQSADIEIKSTDSHEGARRRDIWNATWRMARMHPLLGAGLGGFWAEVPIYHDASGAQTPVQAHNDYLELLASAGLVGMGIFAWFAVALVKRARWLIETLSGFQRAAALGALAGIVGVGIHSLVDFGLHITSNALLFVMLLSILSIDKIANGAQRKRIKSHRSDGVPSDVLMVHDSEIGRR